MGMKHRKWPPFKEMLFIYLAITKIFYWYNTIIETAQNDLGSVGWVILNRLLGQDLIIIASIIIMFLLDNYIQKGSYIEGQKYSRVLREIKIYAFGYVAFIGFILIYFWTLSTLLGDRMNWGFVIVYSSAAYLVVSAGLETKLYFKRKFAPADALPIHSVEDKLAMLKALHDDGILTQEEYDSKLQEVKLL